MTDSGTVLEVWGLRVCTGSGRAIVEDVDLRLDAREIVCVVGESGSGKTTMATALLGYSAPGLEIVAGKLTIQGRELRMDESMRPLRGSYISYVPQNPGRALNPSLRIRDSIRDILRAHRTKQDRDDPRQVLDRVGLDADFAGRFPHQLSGGQQQRVCIGNALSCDPGVVVLDEPTTGLDVVTQARILKELLRLRDEQGVAMLYVTHDLAVAAQIADRIVVVYAGRIVEQGPALAVLRRPRHPYTRGLLASIPDHVHPRQLESMPGIAAGVSERGTGCAFAARCPLRTDECLEEVPALVEVGDRHSARCLHWRRIPAIEVKELTTAPPDHEQNTVLDVRGLEAGYQSQGQTVLAAKRVSFTVERGACVALVGESGSGKTTILRTIAGLHEMSAGEILLNGQVLPSLARRRTVEQRRRVQLISQNPADALNPRRSVRDAIERPMRLLRGLSKDAAAEEVAKLMEQVRLPARLAASYPHELSGGERQRVSIARALAAQPELILCDEITSALDVSVQAAVLTLLSELRQDLGLSLLFITHDLGVVAAVADETLVLDQGRVCERGSTRSLLTAPQEEYTRTLLDAAPSLEAHSA